MYVSIFSFMEPWDHCDLSFLIINAREHFSFSLFFWCLDYLFCYYFHIDREKSTPSLGLCLCGIGDWP